jgi:hypothetical protein
MIHMCVYSKDFPQCMFYRHEFITYVSRLILFTIARIVQKHWNKATNNTYSAVGCIHLLKKKLIHSWRMSPSGMWRRVDIVWTYISEECITSIFRVEKSASEEPAWAVAADWATSRKLLSAITQDLHGTTSQKTAFFIVTAVKTSAPSFNLVSNELKSSLLSLCATATMNLRVNYVGMPFSVRSLKWSEICICKKSHFDYGDFNLIWTLIRKYTAHFRKR